MINISYDCRAQLSPASLWSPGTRKSSQYFRLEKCFTEGEQNTEQNTEHSSGWWYTSAIFSKKLITKDNGFSHTILDYIDSGY